MECLEGDKANAAFNLTKKKVCYGFYQDSERVIKINVATEIKADQYIEENDFYIVDEEFSWTYVCTHEDDCGPYFYKP